MSLSSNTIEPASSKESGRKKPNARSRGLNSTTGGLERTASLRITEEVIKFDLFIEMFGH